VSEGDGAALGLTREASEAGLLDDGEGFARRRLRLARDSHVVEREAGELHALGMA